NLVSQTQPTPTHGLRRKPDQDALRRRSFEQRVRYWVALDARNRSAGTALELYFRLAEAEVSADLLRETQSVLAATIDQMEKGREKGIKWPVEVATFQRSRIETATQADELELRIRQLNVELKSRLGLPDSPGARLWPTKDWPVAPVALDADAAVGV